MCPNLEESTRLVQSSAMSYRAVTAGNPRLVPDVSRKSSSYKGVKKLEKQNVDWESQLDPPELSSISPPTNLYHISQSNQLNNGPTLTKSGYTEKLTSQARKTEPNKTQELPKDQEFRTVEKLKNEGAKPRPTMKSPDGKHAVLSEEDLATFRTSFCTKHHQNKCPNSDSCEKSHCLTWQRRNPYEISYCPHLCPEIQFVKKSRKMVLYRRCTRGKNCNFAHSKEEELYHPLVYKTKQCSAYPKCSRYFCPFVHDQSEMRDVTKFKSFSEGLTKEEITKEVTGKGKDEMAETSFEFDCLDTLNDPETYRDNNYETYKGQELNGNKEKEKKEDQITQFQGDLGVWYEMPNVGETAYNEHFKTYEPYQVEYGSETYQVPTYITNYQDNYTESYQDQEEYYTNYPNLSATASTSSNNYQSNRDSYSNSSNNYPPSPNTYSAGNYGDNGTSSETGYQNYYNYQDNYEGFQNNYEYYNQEYNYNNEYSYDFGNDYLQYSHDLDDHFNNLNLNLNTNNNVNNNTNVNNNNNSNNNNNITVKKEEDYSLNDMLAKFINEIGEK